MPDTIAVGKASELQEEWIKTQNINLKERVHLQKLSHMRYQHPDLEEISGFMIGTVSVLSLTALPHN